MFTQIGSLPHVNVNDAVEYSRRHPIPFLPELPELGDSMLDYIKHPGKLSCLDEFKKHEFKKVKIQCVGPATLISSGYEQNDAVARIYDHVSAIVDGLQADQVILFLDEPGIGHVGFDVEMFWSAIFGAFDVISGVHVCGNADWDKLFTSDVKIISFDASQFDITIYPQYRSEKCIAWGVKDEGDIRDFQTGDLLTLPCGMSSQLYSVSDCEIALNKLRLLAQQFSKY